MAAAEIERWIRDVPDFPKPGIVFKDITPLLRAPGAFNAAIEGMGEGIRRFDAELLVGIEARGFMFAGALAFHLRLPFAPVRKPGKLPWRAVREEYDLEYGTDALEMHEDALAGAARVVVVDDVLATGGTAAAVGRLVERLGGRVCGFSFLVELGFLKGRARLGAAPVHSLLSY